MMRKIVQQQISLKGANRIHEVSHLKQLSDDEILDIQEKFLHVGFHYLKSNSITTGREIIYSFLKSLSLHTKEIGCLTTEESRLPKGTTDILHEVADYLSVEYDLEDYFIEHFNFDFIWIEATESLLSNEWLEKIKNLLIGLGINRSIPILVCSYG